MKKLVTTIISCVLSCFAIAQGTTAYNYYRNNEYQNSGGSFFDLIELQDGDLMFTGRKAGDILMRTDQNGVRKWIKKHQVTNGDMYISDMIPNSNSSYILRGQTIVNGQEGMFVAKADTSGNIQWAKRLYRTVASESHSIIKTWDDHILLLGADSLRTLLVKMDTLGNVIWSKHYYGDLLPYNYSGGTWMASDLVELPDHTITLGINTVDYVPNTTYTVSSASLVHLDVNGNILWAKKMAPILPQYFYPLPFPYAGPWGNFVWDMAYASDDTYIISNYNRTMKVDANGEPIPANYWFGHAIKIISEYPVGTLNILSTGTSVGDNVLWDDAVFYRTDLNMNILSAVELWEGQGNGQYFEVPNAVQLNDHRVVFAGNILGLNTNVITDPLGQQSCVSHNVTLPSFLDTSMHAYPVTLLTDAGIFSEDVFVATIEDTVLHCNCDSLPPVASFTYTVSGLTVTFTNTSQNATHCWWNFGDGTTSTDQNPVHTYTGSFPGNMYLVAYNNCSDHVYQTNIGPSIQVNDDTLACDGLCNGAASVNVIAGNPPYTYLWNTTPPQTTSMATGLCVGTYDVTVTDANGLHNTQSIEIVESYFSADINTNAYNYCHGDSTGMLTANTYMGFSPVSYVWNNDPNLTSNTLSNLPEGVYTVMATDAIGCTAYDTVILVADTLTIATSASTDLNTACIAAAEVTVISGAPPYQYLWSNTQTTPIATDLCGGQSYIITVTDGWSCTQTDTVFIPDSITTVGISGTPKDELTIWPNPVKDVFAISWVEDMSPTNIVVTTITGAMVQEIPVRDTKQGSLQVYAGRWAAGSYLVSIYGTDRQLIKLIKLYKE